MPTLPTITVDISWRPAWTVNIAVDKVSFYIGAIALGLALRNYEPHNIDNINYINLQGQPSELISELIGTTISHPIAILGRAGVMLNYTLLERALVGGFLYVGIGLISSELFNVSHPLISGSLTGLYFSYGSSFSSTFKASMGFALFSCTFELLYYLANR